MYFAREGDITYVGLHFRGCDHLVPFGQFELVSLSEPKITSFDDFHVDFMQQYSETGNLELYQKAKRMVKIANGEIKLNF